MDRSDRSSSRTVRSFVRIGARAGVEVFQREDSPSVELLAVGVIEARSSEVQDLLREQIDPRVLASIAESWSAGSAPLSTTLTEGLMLPNANDVDFSLGVRTSEEGPVRVSFQIADERGDITRVRNWVSAIRGAWKLEPVDEGEATRVYCHVQIDFASSLSRWVLRAGAVQDLPNLFECLRLLADQRRLGRPRRRAVSAL